MPITEDEIQAAIKAVIIMEHDGNCSRCNIEYYLKDIKEELNKEAPDLKKIRDKIINAECSIKNLGKYIDNLYPVEKFLKALKNDLSPRT
jgi:hypothetical protein